MDRVYPAGVVQLAGTPDEPPVRVMDTPELPFVVGAHLPTLVELPAALEAVNVLQMTTVAAPAGVAPMANIAALGSATAPASPMRIRRISSLPWCSRRTPSI